MCTTPLFSALRSRWPGCWIGALVNSYNAAVLDGNPDLDEVVVYTKLKHLEAGASACAALAARLQSLWRLRRRRLDYVVLATPQFVARTVRLARWLAPKRVIGHSDAGGTSRYLDYAVPTSQVERMHEVQRVFALAEPLGIRDPMPPLKVLAQAGAVSRARAAFGSRSRTMKVAIQISARRPAQRWPARQYVTLIRRLHDLGAATMLLWAPGPTGDPRHPGDDETAAHIAAAVDSCPSFVAYRAARLPELIGALAACDAVVTSDGGAMHLAAGLGKPIVCLFGDMPPERWHPWGVPHRVLRPESRRVEDLSVDEVVAAFSQLVGECHLAFRQSGP